MQKLTVTVKDACEMLSISRSKLYAMLADGAPLESIMVGRRRLITTDSLKALVDSGIAATTKKGS